MNSLDNAVLEVDLSTITGAYSRSCDNASNRRKSKESLDLIRSRLSKLDMSRSLDSVFGVITVSGAKAEINSLNKLDKYLQ